MRTWSAIWMQLAVNRRWSRFKVGFSQQSPSSSHDYYLDQNDHRHHDDHDQVGKLLSSLNFCVGQIPIKQVSSITVHNFYTLIAITCCHHPSGDDDAGDVADDDAGDSADDDDDGDDDQRLF